MKKIILDEKNKETKSISNTEASKIYAYQTEKGHLYILSKLGKSVNSSSPNFYYYGFVPVSQTNVVPVFLSPDLKGSIKSALNSSRNVMEFNNFTELMKWKLKIQ